MISGLRLLKPGAYFGHQFVEFQEVDHRVTSGGFHENPEDRIDTWSRLTAEIRDKQGKQMIFEMNGRTLKRVHMAEDPKYWPKPGSLKLKE